MDAPPTVAELVDRLGLSPHPEGGWYRETYRSGVLVEGRSAGTAILFLLGAGERSHWHRVDADELWIHTAGDPLTLSIAHDASSTPVDHLVGAPGESGATPQVLVTAGAWQAAASTGAWSLVSCVVVPGFEFDGFELADPDFTPGGA